MKTVIIAFALTLVYAAAGLAQAPDPSAAIAAQKDAMKPFAGHYGIWRGTGSFVMGDGKKAEIVQTERVGPFLDGSVVVIEGRGYNPNTKAVVFNAFGTIWYNPRTKAYTLHSHAEGQTGDFPITVTPDGYIWQIAAGPAMTMRYTAVIKDGTWHEIGERITEGKEPVKFFEMTLKRIGSTDWPAAGAIPMQ